MIKLITFLLLVLTIPAFIEIYNTNTTEPEIVEVIEYIQSPTLGNDSFIKQNQYRASLGVDNLIYDDRLCEIGLVRVKEIQTDWSHDGFFRRGNNGEYKAAINYYRMGENLARGYDNSDSLILSWHISPTHQKNMAANYFTHSCIVCEDFYCAAMFASY
jgi:uncharacterized protein YkwD